MSNRIEGPAPERKHLFPFMDKVYQVSQFLAAACLLCVFFTIVAQVGARWGNIAFPGSTKYAGYFMAASTFFALAAALQNGVHIRISIILARLGRFRSVADACATAVATLIAGFVAYEACRMVYWSWALGDVSQGQDATPLWIPQVAMAAGAIVFACALVEQTIQAFSKCFSGRLGADLNSR